MSKPREALSSEQYHPQAEAAIASFHADVVSHAKSSLQDSDVLVIGMARNPFCKKAVALLKGAQIEHLYWECGGYLSDWKKRLAIKMWSGWPTFPQVFVKGKLLGGFAELEKCHQSGELTRWLEQSG